jgi:hypothetical protein
MMVIGVSACEQLRQFWAIPHFLGGMDVGQPIWIGCPLPLASGWRWIVIDDDYGLRLLAGENERDDPTDERDTKKEVEYDNSHGVRAFSLDGHDRGQKIKGQYQK